MTGLIVIVVAYYFVFGLSTAVLMNAIHRANIGAALIALAAWPIALPIAAIFVFAYRKESS